MYFAFIFRAFKTVCRQCPDYKDPDGGNRGDDKDGKTGETLLCLEIFTHLVYNVCTLFTVHLYYKKITFIQNDVVIWTTAAVWLFRLLN